MNEPPGSTLARLGDVVEAKYGKSLPAGVRKGGAVPVYGSNGVVGYHDQALTSGPAVIIGRKGSSGEINFSDGPCWPIDTTYFIDDPGPFRIEFLDWLLRSLGLQNLDRSTAIPGLSRDQLYDIEISVPDSAAQDRVVTFLGQYEKLRESATRQLDSTRRSVGRLRQSVLAAACSGRLTEEWRNARLESDDAESILAAILKSRESDRKRRKKADDSTSDERPGLPGGWLWTTIGALVDVATGATPLRQRQDYYGGTIPWVTSGAVNDGLITKAKEFITDLAVHDTNAKVFPTGTLLVAMYGEGQTRGRVGELRISAATNQAVAALLFNEANEFLRPYLRVFLLENYERIRALAFGGVQPNLSLGIVRDMPLPLPPLESEQVEIVRRVEEFLRLSDLLIKNVESADKLASKSSQAAIAQAFQGSRIEGSG